MASQNVAPSSSSQKSMSSTQAGNKDGYSVTKRLRQDLTTLMVRKIDVSGFIRLGWAEVGPIAVNFTAYYINVRSVILINRCQVILRYLVSLLGTTCSTGLPPLLDPAEQLTMDSATNSTSRSQPATHTSLPLFDSRLQYSILTLMNTETSVWIY